MCIKKWRFRLQTNLGCRLKERQKDVRYVSFLIYILGYCSGTQVEDKYITTTALAAIFVAYPFLRSREAR